MTSNPLVSVSVVTYQHVNYIKQCLDGILMQQTNFPFEIILGEDESSDGTREICIEYANKYPERIRLFLRSRKDVIYINGNPTGRYNFIENLKASKGKYIALCEGDDYWTDPLKLQKQVDFLEANPDYSLCFTRFKVKDENENVFKDDKNGHYFKIDDKYIEFDFGIFAKGWHIGTQTLVFNKRFFDINLIFKYKYFRDVYLLTELLKQGRAGCLNFFGAVYRIHEGGIHSSRNELQIYKIASLCYKELYYNNRGIKELKIKYYNFNKVYVELLIKSSSFINAFLNVLKFGIAERDIHFIKANSLKILKIVFKKIKRKIL